MSTINLLCISVNTELMLAESLGTCDKMVLVEIAVLLSKYYCIVKYNLSLGTVSDVTECILTQ